MKILLVRPGRCKQAITLGEFMFSEPIGLECVYTLLGDRHQVKILDLMAGDEDFFEECRTFQPDAIGFTSLCIDVPSVLELAAQAKCFNPEVITLAGGTQTLLAPESFFCQDIDYVAEFTTVKNLRELFDHLEKGEKVPLINGILSRERGFQGSGVKGINDYIPPTRKATEKYRHAYNYFGYKPCAILQTSRGCASMCNFCMRWKIEGNSAQDEPLAEVIRQILEIQETSIMIFDNDFLHDGSRLDVFCDLLEKKEIRKNFICYASVRNIIKNASRMKRLADNGFQAMLVGYESFRDEDLADYNKKTDTAANLEASRILKEAGIDCWASFILHPDWDKKDFRSFRKYLKKLSPEISTLSPMTPFPGSFLDLKYRERVIYRKEDYDQWSYSVVSILPGKMSLRRYYFEVVKTNLYVNLCLNNAFYMVKKFGCRTVFRVLNGSLKFLARYLKLMVQG